MWWYTAACVIKVTASKCSATSHYAAIPHVLTSANGFACIYELSGSRFPLTGHSMNAACVQQLLVEQRLDRKFL